MSIKVLSPVPGVFYRRPSPEEAPYFEEGDSVKKGEVIGLVEVMKNYFEIKAEDDGVIEEFLAENEALLEAGQEIASITRS